MGEGWGFCNALGVFKGGSCGNKKQGLRLCSWPIAIRIDYPHFSKLCTKCGDNFLRRKRDFDNVFLMQQIAVGTHVLENLDIPIRSTIRERRHVDDQDIPLKPVYPRWLGNKAFQLPLRVDVEDEAASR